MASILEAQNLGMTFDGESYLFRHLQLKFPKTGLIGILGNSGSGKSTLLHLLSGLSSPSEGKVYLCGEEPNKMSENRKRVLRSSDISFLFQHYELLENQSALDNVMMPLLLAGTPRSKAKIEAKEILSKLGLKDFLNKNVNLLSGGERGRVALARALISSPSILFADEPTGALDSLNSEFVMKILKKEAENALILVVSHNKELMNKYADVQLLFEEGNVIVPSLLKEGETFMEENKRVRHARNWKRKILGKHLKEDWWKNGLSFFSIFLGVTSLLLSAGFHLGSPLALQEETRKSLSFPYAEVSQKEVVDVPGQNLHLVKSSLPSEVDAKALIPESELMLEDDLSYFLPSAYPVTLSEIEGNALFVPVWDISLENYGKELLVEGNLSTGFEEIYVNKPFADKYLDCLGQIITVDYLYRFIYQGQKDEIAGQFLFRIVGIVDEFSFLSEPSVYYSYLGLKDELRSIYLPSISKALGSEIDALTYFETYGEDMKSDHYLVFAITPESAELLYLKQENSHEEKASLVVSSRNHAVSSNYLTLCASFDGALLLFSLIALIGVILIVGMAGLSCYYSHKKEAAILRILGAEEEAVYSLYSDETTLVALFASGLAILSSPLFASLANRLLEGNFGIKNMIRIPMSTWLGIPYFIPVFVLFVGLLLSFFAVRIPLLFKRKSSISEEIRDE